MALQIYNQILFAVNLDSTTRHKYISSWSNNFSLLQFLLHSLSFSCFKLFAASSKQASIHERIAGFYFTLTYRENNPLFVSLRSIPSISSETCVKFSWLILGINVFRDWWILRCSSCVSLATAANFHLFLNVAIFWRENVQQYWRLTYLFIFVILNQTWEYNKK